MSANRVIGLDMGGTKILAGVVERDGTVVRREERETPVTSQDALLAALDETLESLLGDERVAALGFGIPSTIDQQAGTAVSSVNVPLAGIAFRARMTQRFGLPVALDNDANVAAVAEWRVGAGRGTNHLVLLTLGTGVGGGLILDGRPYRGAVGAAAELGHVVIDYDGPPCAGMCEGHGHLETLASGRSADEAAEAILGGDADAPRLVEAARAGDARAGEALVEIGRRLGAGLVSLVNVFNPEVIVLGGGFASAGDLVFEPARELVRRQALPPARDLVRIVPAELGPDAGMVGAALIAFETLDDQG